MASTSHPALYAGTPTVAVLDARGLTVRELAWHRTIVGGDTDIRITYHRYDARGCLIQSTDPRLSDAMRNDKRVQPNFMWSYDLTGNILRTQSSDAGRTVTLNDAAGRPRLTVTAADVRQIHRYEGNSSLGRPLAVLEQAVDEEAPRVTERFVWAGSSAEEKSHNLAGQCVRHYDTAGLRRLESVSLTGAVLSHSDQLLTPSEQDVEWVGEDEKGWQQALGLAVYTTQTTTDATGALLSQY